MILFFALLLPWVFFVPIASAGTDKIIGADETLWQPPYLDHLIGASHINVYRLNGKGRSVNAGDFLEFGDQLRAPKESAVRIIFNKECWAVVQGGHDTIIDKSTWATNDHPRAIEFKSGWIRVACVIPIQIVTPAANLEFQSFDGWICARDSMTEVYQEGGSWSFSNADAQKDNPTKQVGRGYFKIQPRKDLQNVRDWDLSELKRQIEPMTGPFLKAVSVADQDLKNEHFYDRFDLAVKNKWQKKPKTD